MRILGLMKGDEQSEANVLPDSDLMTRMGDFMEEVTRAGVMLATDGLKPTSEGKRVALTDGKISVTDGPFTESKEVIASYALFQVDSWDEALHWTSRFLEVLGQGEVELRPIFEPEDFDPSVMPPEELAREKAVREQMGRNAAQ